MCLQESTQCDVWWLTGCVALAVRKRAPEELAVILLLLGWARAGIQVELLVCGDAFQLSAVPVHRNGGRRFLSTVPWSIRRDTGSARFYARWQ
jgi:hypothetical protein